MRAKIYEIISRVMEVPIDRIHDDLTSQQLGTWDSVAHMNLILSLEQEFLLEFNLKEISEMISIELIIDTIRNKLEKK